MWMDDEGGLGTHSHRVAIWDIGKESSYDNMSKLFARDSAGVVFVIDQLYSIENLIKWKLKLQKLLGDEPIPILLV